MLIISNFFSSYIILMFQFVNYRLWEFDESHAVMQMIAFIQSIMIWGIPSSHKTDNKQTTEA